MTFFISIILIFGLSLSWWWVAAALPIYLIERALTEKRQISLASETTRILAEGMSANITKIDVKFDELSQRIALAEGAIIKLTEKLVNETIIKNIEMESSNRSRFREIQHNLAVIGEDIVRIKERTETGIKQAYLEGFKNLAEKILAHEVAIEKIIKETSACNIEILQAEVRRTSDPLNEVAEHSILVKAIWPILSHKEKFDFVRRYPFAIKDFSVEDYNDSPAIIKMLFLGNSNFTKTNSSLLSNFNPLDLHKAIPDDLRRIGISLRSTKFEMVAEQLTHEELLAYLSLTNYCNICYSLSYIKKKIESSQWTGGFLFDILRVAGKKNYLAKRYNAAEEAADGYEWTYFNEKDYEAWWIYAAETDDPDIRCAIADNFPCRFDHVFKIPRKAMQNEQILESLVWRKYEPAIKEIECNPDIYSEKLKKAVKNKIYNRFDNLI